MRFRVTDIHYQISRILNLFINLMADAFQAVKAKTSDELKWLELVVQYVSSLQYGVVEIVVHDSHVIQIEKTERIRLERERAEKNLKKDNSSS